jgi:hypothetical protein
MLGQAENVSIHEICQFTKRRGLVTEE